MVFPSFAFQVETGLISQVSTLLLIAFSIAINFWKRIVIYAALTITLVVGAKSAFAFAAMPGVCGTMCANNTQYYGSPWVRPGSYYYPGLNYHSFYGPTPYYFMPHGASPYRPQWMYNCPHCGGNQGWQQQQQWWGPGQQNAPAS